jgi:iron complex outermembrane receptor protein
MILSFSRAGTRRGKRVMNNRIGNARSRAPLAAFIVLALSAGGVILGAENPKPEPSAEYVEQLEVLADLPDVEADRLEVEIEPIDLEILESGREPNLGLAVGSIAGVSGVRRSQNSYEPVVRGLGWERVQTKVNGMPLYGACPSRMDPPAFVVAASSADEVSVVKGLASVALGPAGTGGRVLVSTEYDRGAGAGKATHPWARLSHNGANDGYAGSAGVKGGTDRIDYSVGAELLDQGDYESADGNLVPANQEESGGFFSFGHRPADGQRWFASAMVQSGERIAYPSLPMDTDSADTAIYSGGYRYRPSRSGGPLASLEVSLGLSDLEHVMSNRYRTNRPMVEAETHSTSETRSVGLLTRWSVNSGTVVRGGFDFNVADRDALRQRYVPAVDRTMYDRLWPDVSQDDIGLYGEYSFATAGDWNLRFGLRYDRVSSEAAAADAPSLFGRTVREWYVFFYGEDAAVTDRDEGLLTGNFLFSKEVGAGTTLFGGLGLVSRAAGAKERYFAFAMSPIGYLVGNPTLDAEWKREVSLGIRFGGEAWTGSVAAYYYSVSDYILQIPFDSLDVDGDGQEDDLVYGYENTDATLAGIDLSFVYHPAERWSVPGSFFYVWGKDDLREVPLPEIPPLDLRIAARRTFSGRVSGWLELGARFVGEATRIDPAFPENETPSFHVWHLRGRCALSRHFAFEAGIENLLDTEYWEHLTREAAGNVPGLTPGQEIPNPGRFFTLALRADF